MAEATAPIQPGPNGPNAIDVTKPEQTVAKQPPAPQPGPNLIDIITVLAEKADPIVKLLTTTMEGYHKGKEREGRLQTRMAWAAVSVVIVIVCVSAFLTYKGK